MLYQQATAAVNEISNIFINSIYCTTVHMNGDTSLSQPVHTKTILSLRRLAQNTRYRDQSATNNILPLTALRGRIREVSLIAEKGG